MLQLGLTWWGARLLLAIFAAETLKAFLFLVVVTLLVVFVAAVAVVVVVLLALRLIVALTLARIALREGGKLLFGDAHAN